MKNKIKKRAELKPSFLLEKLKKERERYSPKNKDRMQKIIDSLVKNDTYPSEPTPAMRDYGYSILNMVESWGVEWYRFKGKSICQYCGANLNDEKNGPPFKRSVGIYSMGKDRTVDTVCPECYRSINDGKQYDKEPEYQRSKNGKRIPF